MSTEQPLSIDQIEQDLNFNRTIAWHLQRWRKTSQTSIPDILSKLQVTEYELQSWESGLSLPVTWKFHELISLYGETAYAEATLLMNLLSISARNLRREIARKNSR